MTYRRIRTRNGVERPWARELRTYLILAGSYFGLYALLLTLIPSRAIQEAHTLLEASVLLAVLAGAGLVGDFIVGRATARFGIRRVILFGSAMAAVGVGLLMFANGFLMFVAAVVTLGLALSLMMTPILSGLASHAGKRQVHAQSVNAVWQRAGALLAALFLINPLGSSGTLPIASALALAVLTLALCALNLPKSKVESRHAPGRSTNGVLALMRASPLLQAGLVVNTSTTLLIIVGSSFLPLVLLAMLRPELLFACLVGREILAITAAFSVRNLTRRRTIEYVWMGCSAAGAAGLLGALMVDSTFAVVLLFSLHGAALSLGIVLGNVRIFDGTVPETRIQGYALSAMVARVAGLVFPVFLGLMLDQSPAFALGATAAIVVFGGVAYAGILARGDGKSSLREVAQAGIPRSHV